MGSEANTYRRLLTSGWTGLVLLLLVVLGVLMIFWPAFRQSVGPLWPLYPFVGLGYIFFVVPYLARKNRRE